MSLARNLGELADQIRTDAATLGEVQAKQGWVVGIAKLALATPWLVVAMLGTRPENAILYNSPTGLALLLGGLIACILAFAAIQRMSAMTGTAVPEWLGHLFEGLDEKPAARQLVAATVAAEFCRRLYAGGVRNFHFYTLNRAELSYAICHLLGLRPETEA